MDDVNTNISILFKQRIVPGVYQFDIAITNPPYCGSVIGTIIHGIEKNMISIPDELESQKAELQQMTYELYKKLKEMFGD